MAGLVLLQCLLLLYGLSGESHANTFIFSLSLTAFVIFKYCTFSIMHFSFNFFLTKQVSHLIVIKQVYKSD